MTSGGVGGGEMEWSSRGLDGPGLPWCERMALMLSVGPALIPNTTPREPT